MRKILAAILTALCTACLVLAFGCSGCNDEPSYYKLTFQTVDGVTYDFYGYVDGEKLELQNGAQVKEGNTVYFTFTKDDNVIGEAVVKANDEEELTAGDDGVYTFVMNKDMDIAVTGLVQQQACTVYFEKGDNRINYYDTDGTELTSLDVVAGDSVSFKLNVSVYYDRTSYTVLANTTIVKPDDDGVYKFTATQDTNITVENLSLEETFADRGAGAGTQANPYQISRPIDLYLLADLVNDEFWAASFAGAYYIMTDDIDMEGEQLFIIGDGTSDTAFFYGDFNGNGKTISNYYISDTIIEQSAYTNVFLPYIGLFGQAMAVTYRSPSIYNLNLSNFTIEVNADTYKSTFCAGGVVGLALGANIYNCTVDGTIRANAAAAYPGYIGGVVGFMQSAYVSDDLRYYSSLVGCVSNAEVSGLSGYIVGAGGITGYLMAHEEKTAAYILNCVNTGNIAGAVYTGGIVGMVSAYGSVKNSYSTGYVEAYARYGIVSGDSSYAYSYAGGISGYLDYDGVISNCFSTSHVSASALLGASYANSGDIVGGLSSGGSSNIESSAGLSINNKKYSSMPSAQTIKDELGWLERDWNFSGNPTPKAATSISVSASLVNSSDNSLKSKVTLNDFMPISYWYEDQLAQFVSDGDNRSYGYYFTNKNGTLSDKVPYSYVLTGEETLYFAYADYSQVAGEYYANYAGTGVDGGNVVLTLATNGTLTYSEGANIYVTYYIYDGTTITLYDCPALIETDEDDGDYYTSAQATLSNGVLTIVNNITYSGSKALKAIKKLDNFTYGSYKGESNDVYVFNANGTGTKGTNSFTYTIDSSANTITVKIGSNSYEGAVSNGVIQNVGTDNLTAYDIFAGTWELSASIHKQYTFDGLGNWTYKYFGYNNGEEQVIATDSGTYTYNSSDNTISLKDKNLTDKNITVDFNSDGYLEVKNTENNAVQVYYSKSSVAGTWRFAYRTEAIEIAFSGIGSKGYGEAVVKYESLSEPITMTYDVRQGTYNNQVVDLIYIFYENENYAVLRYNTLNSTLTGTVYVADDGEFVSGAVFNLYDDYKGNWISSKWQSIEFNGFGLYNMQGTTTTLAVRGTVKINGQTYYYTLNNSTMEGVIRVGSTEYTIKYDEVSGTVAVSTDSETFTLTRYDSWHDLTLVDTDGNTYTFNGGGNLENGGTLTIGATEYIYKVNGASVNVYTTTDTTTVVGTISVEGNQYKYGDKVLTVKNDFTGNWAVSGAPDSSLVIGEIGADGKASGTYLGTEVTFTYNAASNYLTFTNGGRTMYIMSLSAGSKTELAIAYYANTQYGFIGCVAVDNLDGYQGTYTLGSTTLKLDGLGASSYTKGVATITYANGTSETLTYTINKFNMPVLSNGYILKPVSTTENVYVGANYKLAAVTADVLYGIESIAKVGSEQVTYIFNGVGEVTVSGNTYSYTVVSNDTLKLIVTVKITINGEEMTAQVDYSTTDYALTFTA